MKTKIGILILFLFLAAFGIGKAQNSSVLLELRNIEQLKGNLFVSLSKDSLQFSNFKNAAKESLKKIPVKSGMETVLFNNLEAGWYAIAVFQDLNGNDSLDTKRFGIPTEPFGFSNNALARFRPPWFKKACFYVESGTQIATSIDLIYRKPKRVKSDAKKNEK